MELLLNDAIERIKPYVADAIVTNDPTYNENYYRGEDTYGYFDSTATAHVARLRLDWEFVVEDTLENLEAWLEDNKVALTDAMLDFFKLELADLIENGDVDNYQDALLKSMDGAKKRGAEPTLVDIFSAHLYREYKPKKNSIEFTLYVLLATKWS